MQGMCSEVAGKYCVGPWFKHDGLLGALQGLVGLRTGLMLVVLQRLRHGSPSTEECLWLTLQDGTCLLLLPGKRLLPATP